jgi:Fe-S-cluster containining protein
VSAVEAAQVDTLIATLPAELRAELARRGRHELEREARGETGARCAMLGPDGGCAVYEARPLVCRTQGHALRYLSGLIPAAAVVAKSAGGEVTHCLLNFTNAPPAASDVLDAERVDQILALVNHRFAEAHGADSEARFPLSLLAAEADVLERPGL